MKVLVTGGAGQLARSLVELAPADVEPLAPARAKFDLLNVGQMQAAIERERPDCVINTAAYTAVDRAESDAEAAFAVNAQAAASLAELCAAHQVRLLHVSTDYVFSGETDHPWRPEDTPCPSSVYGRSKAEGETLVRERLPTATIVRTAWLYSRHGSNFVKTMLNLIAKGGELPVVADQIGAPTCADNLARVLWAFTIKPVAGVFHYTDAGVASWYDFALGIAEEGKAAGILDAPARIVPADTASFPRPALRPSFSVLDCRSTHVHTGIAPEHWRVGLRRLLQGLATERLQ